MDHRLSYMRKRRKSPDLSCRLLRSGPFTTKDWRHTGLREASGAAENEIIGSEFGNTTVDAHWQGLFV